jgi:hypothetical protein
MYIILSSATSLYKDQGRNDAYRVETADWIIFIQLAIKLAGQCSTQSTRIVEINVRRFTHLV